MRRVKPCPRTRGFVLGVEQALARRLVPLARRPVQRGARVLVGRVDVGAVRDEPRELLHHADGRELAQLRHVHGHVATAHRVRELQETCQGKCWREGKMRGQGGGGRFARRGAPN